MNLYSSELSLINLSFMKRLSIISVLLLNPLFLHAEPLKVTQTVSGPTGLVEMPTARMFPVGEFSIHYSEASPYSRYVVTAQPLDWLQVLFKYTDVAYRLYGPSIAGTQTYKDKSTDIKVRLFKEDYYWPEVAIGINDIGGTGLFSGEYLALNKQFRRFDFTLGMGWGYLGSRGHIKNPLTYLSDSFKSRTASSQFGGTIDPTSFFAGEKVSLYAGAEYHFESWPLALKFEYDANNYQKEPFGKSLKQDIPFNASAVYSYNKNVDFHAGIVRGNQAMLGLTLRLNLTSTGPKKILDTEPLAVYDSVLNPKPVMQDLSWNGMALQLNENSGIDVRRIQLQGDSVLVKGKQKLFREKAKGIGRASRILTNNLPEEIEDFVFVEEFNGIDLSAIKINRQTFDKAAKLEVADDKVLETTSFTPNAQSSVKNSAVQTVYDSGKKAFDYFLAPTFSGSLGGPDAFLLYQLGLGANANYYLRDNSWFSGSIELGLLDNYDTFNYTAPSKLPRVRTNIKEYLKTSNVRLSRLQFTDVESFADDFFVQAYLGYLESMYAGVGAEMLYRPHNKNWAIGLDANYLKQRSFDQKFGFREYAVKTGHLTGYYEMDNKILVKASAGRYLANDVGVTLDISRKFHSGAQLGFWATKTNVSAEQFGEGSFDKGFYIKIPMNMFTFKSTAETAGFKWQFLTRDGGQKLNKKYDLYDMTESRSLGFVKDSFDKVLH